MSELSQLYLAKAEESLLHTADYAPDLVTQRQSTRALQRTQDFLAAVREKVSIHEI